jgi:hypothetical protein
MVQPRRCRELGATRMGVILAAKPDAAPVAADRRAQWRFGPWPTPCPGTVSVPGFRWPYRFPRCLLSLRLPLPLTLILRGVLVRGRLRDR